MSLSSNPPPENAYHSVMSDDKVQGQQVMEDQDFGILNPEMDDAKCFWGGVLCLCVYEGWCV